MLALRLLGGAHALALSGQAPELAASTRAPAAPPETSPGSPHAWAALRRTLAEHGGTIAAGSTIRRRPTRWAGRRPCSAGCGTSRPSSTLPIRLIEVGASAGLNLRADHFFVPGESGSYGDPASPVVLAGGWLGDAAAGGANPDHRADRRRPLAGRPADRERAGSALTAYVWPDQADRLGRLRGAFWTRRPSTCATASRVSVGDARAHRAGARDLDCGLALDLPAVPDAGTASRTRRGRGSARRRGYCVGPLRLRLPGTVTGRRLPGHPDDLARQATGGSSDPRPRTACRSAGAGWPRISRTDAPKAARPGHDATARSA